jgi:hypothetical protein
MSRPERAPDPGVQRLAPQHLPVGRVKGDRLHLDQLLVIPGHSHRRLRQPEHLRRSISACRPRPSSLASCSSRHLRVVPPSQASPAERSFRTASTKQRVSCIQTDFEKRGKQRPRAASHMRTTSACRARFTILVRHGKIVIRNGENVPNGGSARGYQGQQPTAQQSRFSP